MRLRKIFAGALCAAAVTGCGTGGDFQDLQAFMDEVESRPKGRIAPLPEFRAYEAFAYSAANMRSPFEPPQVVKPIPQGQARSNVKPDSNRVKQFLEQFNIAQLEMVGTLSQSTTVYGLIQDSDGGVHRVRTGDYMGTDHGRILAINESEIEMIEIVTDGTGGWIERSRTVSIGGGES
jgi:type IV pilus assembly protein PilP